MAVLFDEFQYSLISELEKFWKQKNKISPETDFSLNVSFSAETLSSWLSFRETLSSMPIVRKVAPISLSESTGLVRITISGNIPQFITNLNSIGYKLTETEDMFMLSIK